MALGHPEAQVGVVAEAPWEIWPQSWRTDPSATWPWGPREAGLWGREMLSPPRSPPGRRGWKMAVGRVLCLSQDLSDYPPPE